MLIDVLLILHYSDVGQNWNSAQNGRRRGSYDIEVSNANGVVMNCFTICYYDCILFLLLHFC